MKKKNTGKNTGKNTVRYFAKNFSTLLGIVLIWRGIWYLLDFVDRVIFDGEHLVTVLLGILVGFLILYLPDHDLKEIEKL